MVQEKEKPFWQSKTVWGGLLVVAGGIFTAVGKLINNELDILMFTEQILPLVGVGLGIVGIRFANKKIF